MLAREDPEDLIAETLADDVDPGEIEDGVTELSQPLGDALAPLSARSATCQIRQA